MRKKKKNLYKLRLVIVFYKQLQLFFSQFIIGYSGAEEVSEKTQHHRVCSVRTGGIADN